MPTYAVVTEGAEALAAATAETLLQVRGAATGRARIRRIGVAFDGATATAVPVLIRLLFQTTDGTATGATETPVDGGAVVAACTSFHSFTAEPTAGGVVCEFLVHPQGGSWVYEFPDDDSAPTLTAATTSRIGLEATAPAIVNARAFMHWREFV